MPSRGSPPALGRRRFDLLLIGGIIVVWGLSWPVMKTSVATIPPIWFTVLRYLIGASVLGCILVALGRLRLPSRRDLPIVLSVGLLQMLVFTALAATALRILPAGRAVVLAYTMPLWVLPMAAVLLRERIGMRRGLSCVLGVAGIVALVDFGGPGPGGTSGILPYALLLAAAMAWAVCMVHVSHHRWAASALDLAPWQMALAAACLLPFAVATEGAPKALWIVGEWQRLLFVGVLATAFCSWAVVDVGTRVGAGSMSIVMTGVPAVGLTTSLALGYDTPSIAVLAGAGAILIAIGLVAREEMLLRRAPAADGAPGRDQDPGATQAYAVAGRLSGAGPPAHS